MDRGTGELCPWDHKSLMISATKQQQQQSILCGTVNTRKRNTKFSEELSDLPGANFRVNFAFIWQSSNWLVFLFFSQAVYLLTHLSPGKIRRCEDDK